MMQHDSEYEKISEIWSTSLMPANIPFEQNSAVNAVITAAPSPASDVLRIVRSNFLDLLTRLDILENRPNPTSDPINR